MNSNLSDIASSISTSVASTGVTPITGQLKGLVSALPCYAFTSDLTTGFGQSVAGAAYIDVSGTRVVDFTSAGVAITGTLSISGGFSGTIATSGSTAGFIAFEGTSTDAGAAAGPSFSAYRNSASPAVNDVIGSYDFYGRNSTPAKYLYSRIAGVISDSTAATEDGQVIIQAAINGTLTTVATFDVTGVTLPANFGVKVDSNPTATPGKTPTYQVFNSGTSATYTRPAGVTWIRVRAVAGGGGGNGGGTGGSTIWDVGGANVTANGGAAGAAGSGATPGIGGAGGVSGSGTATLRVPGGSGGRGVGNNTGGGGLINCPGGQGGGTYFSGGPGSDIAVGANTGTGGAAALTSAGAGGSSGGGGGGGEYFELIVGSPSATYLYTVGAAGTGGGISPGSAGRIVVEEYYN